MNQDDMPAPAVVDEEKAVKEDENAFVEHVQPALQGPASEPAQAPRQAAVAPDPFAVGVRVLKMAPAWLLFMAVGCSMLVFLLGWMRSEGAASAVTLPTKGNDSRPARRAAATVSTAAKLDAVPVADDSKAAKDAPAPLPAAQPKEVEKARVETFAQPSEAEGNFTAQVGSFNSQSEANECVSQLRAAGFEAYVAAAELPSRGTWYRAQVGRFADRAEAVKTVAALRAKGAASSALVVPIQK